MTFSPCRADFRVCNEELYQFLLAQQNGINRHRSQIASISLPIDRVDPLVVLEHLAQPNQLSFYWENQSKKEAIAAIDAVEKLEIAGKTRFIKAEEFIKECLHKINYFPSTNQPFSKPIFFCGFSFFDNNEENYPFSAASIFLPRWQVAVKDNRCVLVANTIINERVNIQKILTALWTKIEIIKSLGYNSSLVNKSSQKYTRKQVANPEKFKSSVSSALEKINSNYLKKIVLADALDIRASHRFNLFQSLNNLRQIHPNCYTFSLSNGKGQNFIGASPERLITIHNQQLIADAMAGSAPRGKTPTEDAINATRLLNSEKEQHEHSLVLNFINQHLCELGLLPQVLAPRLRQLSNIQHLWTPINAVVPANVHPINIVAQLHPTPAVAGASRDFACNEIRRYENFERGLYAAPLGWVDSDGNCEFIVGIRSALIDGDRARLYAGAGIVAGSDPDKELAEIQLKLQALLKALV